MIAFTFPGQGAQRPAMGAAWRDHPSWELVGEAAVHSGRDIGHLLLDANADELRDTRNAQLATFVASLVVLDAVERLGVAPGIVAGHSLGEYTALTATGALSFEDGVRLVVERGAAMAVAAEERPGTMAAVLGGDDDRVEAACRDTDGQVWVANYNAPGQVVVAGEADAVGRAGAAAKERGAKRAMALEVGGAFHTPLMAPAQERLEKALDAVELRAPDVPVVANVDGAPHDDAAGWVERLSAQLCSPVRWRQTLHHLDDAGVTTFVEIGPGRALTSMAKRTARDAATIAVENPDDLDPLLAMVAHQGDTAGAVDEGEQVSMTERVVVSPGAGVFVPETDATSGRHVRAGDLLGRVADHEVPHSLRGDAGRAARRRR
ncbi:MAG: ACP S-malonyltransferase [Acidimicrobiia bacterium]|nr:ACP S-malonyltransferase [Acidimicrobiia bacterium]